MSELGNKHECLGCSTKFYDLGRSELVCPKCGENQKDLAAAQESSAGREKPRRKKTSKAKKKKKKAKAAEDAAESKEAAPAKKAKADKESKDGDKKA